MQTRHSRPRHSWLRFFFTGLLGLMAASALIAARPAAASEGPVPFPAELQKDVDFWIRVYTQATTSEGFLHDERDLSLVYRKLSFTGDVQPRARRAAIAAERMRIEAMLRRLAAGAVDLSEDERAVAALFGDGATSARFRDAARGVRFQLGQSDRFRAGLERSGIWRSHIAQTFARAGLPPELTVLPHVESSFDPTAYSKVGAAGLWQFMRGTGRLYLRVDDAVDERLDPYRATEAAAQLLDGNFRFLESWPLALTAYNHGAAGMRRARDGMGTTDIATIVRGYKSPSFGFASRNFYVSFLAALTIDRDPGKYFGNLTRYPEMAFSEVELPAFVPLAALEKALKVERARLVALNPALRPPVWDGRLFVPKGYRLRLPAESPAFTHASLTQQIDEKDQYVNQPRTRSHRVRQGDTLATVARRHGLSIATLAKLNGLQEDQALRVKSTLRLPDVPATRVAAVRRVAAAEHVGNNVPALAEQRPEPRSAVLPGG